MEGFDPNTSYLQPLQLLWNDGSGHLEEDPSRPGPAFSLPRSARGAAPADFDGDGDVDLLVVRDGAPPLLLRNDLGGPGRHWLKIRLRGEGGSGSAGANREGLGARVEVEAGGRRQVRELRRTRGYLSGGPAELTFGLGPSPQADRVTVHWPGGPTTTCGPLKANRPWTLYQGGACRPVGEWQQAAEGF